MLDYLLRLFAKGEFLDMQFLEQRDFVPKVIRKLTCKLKLYLYQNSLHSYLEHMRIFLHWSISPYPQMAQLRILNTAAKA